jgi:hypothetical protein
MGMMPCPSRYAWEEETIAASAEVAGVFSSTIAQELPRKKTGSEEQRELEKTTRTHW